MFWDRRPTQQVSATTRAVLRIAKKPEAFLVTKGYASFPLSVSWQCPFPQLPLPARELCSTQEVGQAVSEQHSLPRPAEIKSALAPLGHLGNGMVLQRKHTARLRWKQSILCCTHLLCTAGRIAGEKLVKRVEFYFLSLQQRLPPESGMSQFTSAHSSGSLQFLEWLEYKMNTRTSQ